MAGPPGGNKEKKKEKKKEKQREVEERPSSLCFLFFSTERAWERKRESSDEVGHFVRRASTPSASWSAREASR